MAGPHQARRPKKAPYIGFCAAGGTRAPRAVGPGGRFGRAGHRYLSRPISRPMPLPAAPPDRRVRVEVRVELKPGVVDAEAQSIEKALGLLGLAAVPRVRTARVYDLEFSGTSEAQALRLAADAVDRLLANPVIHRVSVRPVPD